MSLSGTGDPNVSIGWYCIQIRPKSGSIADGSLEWYNIIVLAGIMYVLPEWVGLNKTRLGGWSTTFGVQIKIKILSGTIASHPWN